MLIINDLQCRRAGVASLEILCSSCSKPLREYPLILSDEVVPSVYHAACAVQLATEILIDLSTFFCPPDPQDQLFVLTDHLVVCHTNKSIEEEGENMQSTNLGEIKAALWEQAFVGGTQVRCSMGQVVAIRKRNGQFQAMIRGWGRWYPVAEVSIDRMFVHTSPGAFISPDARTLNTQMPTK